MKPIRLVALALAVGSITLAGLVILRKPKEIIKEVKVNAPQVSSEPAVQTVNVLVAANDIVMGKVLTPRDLKWQKWPEDVLSPHFISQKKDPKARENLEGAIARTSFVAGEPLRETKVVKAGSRNFMAAMVSQGMRAIAIPVSPELGAGGFILPNDRVDVILVRRLETDSTRNRSKEELNQEAKTILTNVRTLAVDQVIEEKNGEKTVLARTATLELTPEQAETLALGRQLGVLSLSLRSVVDHGADPVVVGNDGDEEKQSSSPFKKKGDGKSLTVIKFGVPTQATGQ